MTCPYCQSKMRSGYIRNHRTALTWTPKGKRQPWYTPVGFYAKFEIKLGDYEFSQGGVADASYCESCKKVIIDVPDQS